MVSATTTVAEGRSSGNFQSSFGTQEADSFAILFQIFDVVGVFRDLMPSEEAVQFISGFKTEKQPCLERAEGAGTVSLDGQSLDCRPRGVLAIGKEPIGQFVGDFESEPHRGTLARIQFSDSN